MPLVGLAQLGVCSLGASQAVSKTIVRGLPACRQECVMAENLDALAQAIDGASLEKLVVTRELLTRKLWGALLPFEEAALAMLDAAIARREERP